MRNLLEKGDFVSLFGLADVWKYLDISDRSDHATISTDLDSGTIRGLFLNAQREDDQITITLQYLHHADTSNNDVVPFLTLTCQQEGEHIHLTDARVMDADIDVQDGNMVRSLAQTMDYFAEHIVHNNIWINPVEALEKHGLQPPEIGRKAWPGLYVNGDFRSAPSTSSHVSMQEPEIPALFLHSILGVGPDQHADRHDMQTHMMALHGQGQDDETGALKYTYQQGRNKSSLTITGTVSLYAGDTQQDAPLYSIKTAPSSRQGDYAKMTALSYMGQSIDLKNPSAVSSVLKVIRNVNRSIRAGKHHVLEDLKKPPHERRYGLPSSLALHTGAYPFLNGVAKPLPQNGVATFRPLGGTNMDAYMSESDKQIGANQYVLSYEAPAEDGSTQSESIMIDAGILFHDTFDGTFYNAAQYLHHKHDKAHQPQQPVQALFFTHRHKDHIGQLAYLIKCGYSVPPLIMNEMTMRQLKREMSELGIERTVREEILSKCYSINLLKDVNPKAPNDPQTTTIDGTTISQWTEIIPGKDLGSFHCYPRLKIGAFEVRIGPMPHSDPGLMFDVITPAWSHRHTGDYKFDDTIKLGMPPLEPWLQAHHPDSLSADSTGALRPGNNPTEGDVGDSIAQEIHAHPSSRHIFPMLGSNISRLLTLIDAIGQSDRKVLIIDGKAVEDLVRDADKVFGLREWAKRTYGVDVFLRSQEKTVAPYLKDRSRDADYVMCVSGTQDEAYSSINRAARDWLTRYHITDNDVITFLQGVIPVGKNAYKRMALKDAVEMFHQAKVNLPEVIERETRERLDHLGLADKDLLDEGDIKRIFHSSGHNNAGDMSKIITLSQDPDSPEKLLVIPVHGGPEQIQAHINIAEDAGAQTMLLHGSNTAVFKKRHGLSDIRIEPLELVGVTLHTPGKDKFFLKGRFSTTVIPIKPTLNNDTAQILDRVENIAHKLAGLDSDYEFTKTLPLSLSRYFNAQTGHGFLSQSMPFGIDKYKDSVFKEKNIYALATFDSETGGLNPNDDLMREFGMMVENTAGDVHAETQLFQKIAPYRLPSVQAMLTTHTNPYDLDDGLPAHLFMRDIDAAIKALKEHSYTLANQDNPLTPQYKRNEVKALAIAHNAPFDNQFVAKERARNLDTDTRPLQTKGIITIDTRVISRAMAAYHTAGYQVDKNPDTGFLDHTLEGLCRANNIAYDTAQSHGALYDTLPCRALFQKQQELAPDIVAQMIVNADSSTSHLLNDMIGMDTGFDGPHPVFSYVSPLAAKPKAQMGCIVGTLESERYAVIFNLKHDPHKFLHLPAKDIVAMLKDRDNDVFEILDLRKNPIVMPARYGLRVNANGHISKETLDLRASHVKKHRSYVDPNDNWHNIAQKLQNAWATHRDKIFAARLNDPVHEKDRYPDLDQNMDIFGGAIPTPEQGAFALIRMRAQAGFNPVYQNIHKMVRLYLKSLQDEDYNSASANYHNLMHHKDRLENIALTLNNIHYDINPQDLSDHDRQDIEAMRGAIAFRHYHRALKEAEEIQSNPALYDRFIGKDKKKKALFKTIKNWLGEHEHLGTLDHNAKRFTRPWRDITRGDNDNNKPEAPQNTANDLA